MEEPSDGLNEKQKHGKSYGRNKTYLAFGTRSTDPHNSNNNNNNNNNNNIFILIINEYMFTLEKFLNIRLSTLTNIHILKPAITLDNDAGIFH